MSHLYPSAPVRCVLLRRMLRMRKGGGVFCNDAQVLDHKRAYATFV